MVFFSADNVVSLAPPNTWTNPTQLLDDFPEKCQPSSKQQKEVHFEVEPQPPTAAGSSTWAILRDAAEGSKKTAAAAYLDNFNISWFVPVRYGVRAEVRVEVSRIAALVCVCFLNLTQPFLVFPGTTRHLANPNPTRHESRSTIALPIFLQRNRRFRNTISRLYLLKYGDPCHLHGHRSIVCCKQQNIRRLRFHTTLPRADKS